MFANLSLFHDVIKKSLSLFGEKHPLLSAVIAIVWLKMVFEGIVVL